MTQDELLAELNGERELLRRATSIRGFLGVRRRAMRLRERAKADNLGIAIENAAFELQVLAEREVGLRLPKVFPRGGDRKSTLSKEHNSALNAFGITHKQSHRFRGLGRLPTSSITTFIAACTATHKRASTNALLRLIQPPL